MPLSSPFEVKPRVLSVPPPYEKTNKYLSHWYEAAEVEVVLQVKRGTSFGRTVYNPKWLWERRDEFDAYHLQWEIRLARPALLISSAVLCRRLGKRVIWTVHEALPHQRRFTLRAWMSGLFLSHFADRIVVHNKFSEMAVKRLFFASRPIEIVDLPDSPIYPVQQALAKTQLREERFIYFTFGYFHRYKGVDILIRNFDMKMLQAVLYVQGHFGVPPPKGDELIFGRNGVVIRAENLSDEELDLYISAADVVVMPYRRCYTSAAAHRALQHGKVLVVSHAVRRTIDENSERILEYNHESDLSAALLKARTMNTLALPRTTLNIEQQSYRAQLQSLYR